MSKGYLVAFVKVKDPAAFKTYSQAVGPLVRSFGGKVLAADQADIRESANGNISVGSKMVMIEFASPAQVQKFYDSPEYQQAIQLRVGNSDTTFAMVPGVAE